LVVRPHAHLNYLPQHTAAGFRLHRIVVPTDFSACADVGLDYAARFARDFHAELRLVHVINPLDYPFGDEWSALEGARLLRKASSAAQKRLSETGARTGTRFSIKVDHGSAAVGIRDAANHDTDVIIISTHGRTGLGHILLGSTAERLVREALCPVLVIPAGSTSDSKRKSILQGNNLGLGIDRAQSPNCFRRN